MDVLEMITELANQVKEEEYPNPAGPQHVEGLN